MSSTYAFTPVPSLAVSYEYVPFSVPPRWSMRSRPQLLFGPVGLIDWSTMVRTGTSASMPAVRGSVAMRRACSCVSTAAKPSNTSENRIVDPGAIPASDRNASTSVPACNCTM